MNSKPSLLVTGAGGMLGNAFVRHQSDLQRSFSKITFSYRNQLDLTDPRQTVNFLNRLLPDVIINCAAMTIVEDCEKNPDQAYKINSYFPEILAKWTVKHGKKLVHYSTDAVFDGKKGNYTEKDKPRPLNVYAKSKLKGEQSVLKTDPNSLVLRTNIIGIRGREPYPLAEWVIRTLTSGQKVTGFTNILFAPLFVDDVTALTSTAIKKQLSGLFHLNAKNPISKYRFAKLLATDFGYNSDLVVPARSDQILSTPRPRKTYLNSAKFTKKTLIKLPKVQEEIRHLRENYLSLINPGGFYFGH